MSTPHATDNLERRRERTMSLWTPGGEHPVDRPGGARTRPSDAAAAGRRPPPDRQQAHP